MKVLATQLHDQYVDDDGRSVALLNQDVIVLSALATEALRLARTPMKVEELARLLGERFGAPDGVSLEEATTAVVDSLKVRGLLADVTRS